MGLKINIYIILSTSNILFWLSYVPLDTTISMKTRKIIIKTYVWSTLLYGCETWTITTRNVKKLQSFEMSAYRKMTKISWRDKKTNQEVLKLADERLYIL